MPKIKRKNNFDSILKININKIDQLISNYYERNKKQKISIINVIISSKRR